MKESMDTKKMDSLWQYNWFDTEGIACQWSIVREVFVWKLLFASSNIFSNRLYLMSYVPSCHTQMY